MDLDSFSQGLQKKDGIFFATKRSGISYPETGNDEYAKLEDNSFWFKHRNDCIVQAVKKFSPGRIFFDIGGGNGFVAKGLEDAGVETVLVEPGEEGAKNAIKRGLQYVVCSTLEDADFKKDSLPSIGLFDVLEHVKEDGDFLKDICLYLEDEGIVFLTVPAYGFLWSADDVEARHFRRYTRKAMEKKLKAAGFEVIYSTYIFSIVPIAVLLFRTLPSRLRLVKKTKLANNHKDEHKDRGGFAGRLLEKIWKLESGMIKAARPMCFGGSCLIVAKK